MPTNSGTFGKYDIHNSLPWRAHEDTEVMTEATPTTPGRYTYQIRTKQVWAERLANVCMLVVAILLYTHLCWRLWPKPVWSCCCIIWRLHDHACSAKTEYWNHILIFKDCYYQLTEEKADINVPLATKRTIPVKNWYYQPHPQTWCSWSWVGPDSLYQQLSNHIAKILIISKTLEVKPA